MTIKKHLRDQTPIKRGIYRGPERITNKSDIIDAPTETLITDIVRNGYQLSCDTLTHPMFWHDEWTQCPLCGSVPDRQEGVWVHADEQ